MRNDSLEGKSWASSKLCGLTCRLVPRSRRVMKFGTAAFAYLLLFPSLTSLLLTIIIFHWLLLQYYSYYFRFTMMPYIIIIPLSLFLVDKKGTICKPGRGWSVRVWDDWCEGESNQETNMITSSSVMSSLSTRCSSIVNQYDAAFCSLSKYLSLLTQLAVGRKAGDRMDAVGEEILLLVFAGLYPNKKWSKTAYLQPRQKEVAAWEERSYFCDEECQFASQK